MIDKQLFRLIGENKKYIFITVAWMLMGMLANLSITASICYALFLLTEKAAISSLRMPFLIVAVGIAMRYISTILVGNFKDIIGRNVKKDLRQRAYHKIVQLGEKGADNMSMAGLTQVCMEGIEQLDLYYSIYLPQFFFSLISPLILFAISVSINWRVAFALLLCVPVIPMSIVMVSKYAQKVFEKYWGKYTSMGDSFLDSVQGLKELKIFQSDEKQNTYMNKSAEEFRIITMKVLVMQLASITIMDLVAFGGAGVGISFAIAGAKSGASPILALFLILIAADFFLPLRALGSAFHVAMNGASAGKKIITLLEMPEPIWSTEKLDGTEIALRKIHFSYDGKREVLRDVSISFAQRGMHAIVGESGSGKSTIVGMITGANRAQSGEVTIGSKNIESLSREDYYDHLAVVSYNTYIFNTSVRENFYLAKQDISDEEIFESLRRVNLYDFVVENGGLDKVITEDANNISGGQRQRLALAINLAADKEIYIFDEATSNIDIESEAIIMENIQALSQSKSVIVISHRLANVIGADKILYMESGEVKESGTHLELLEKNGGYAKLFQTQKSLEEGYKEVKAYA